MILHYEYSHLLCLLEMNTSVVCFVWIYLFSLNNSLRNCLSVGDGEEGILYDMNPELFTPVIHAF